MATEPLLHHLTVNITTSSLKTLLLVVLTALYIPPVGSSGVVQSQFKTLKSKSLPSSAYSFASQPARGLTGCIAMCGREPDCLSVYATDSSSNGYFSCSLMAMHIHHTYLSSGSGTYAYIDTLETNGDPPSFPAGTYLYTARWQDCIVAVYSFSAISSKWKTLGVLYNHDKWPILETNCASTVYTRLGLSATVIRIVEEPDGHTYRFEAQCQSGETHIEDDICSGGAWTHTGVVSVACVSSNCYRVDSSNRARYNGDVKNTRYGTGCSRWDTIYGIEDSQFPLDGYNESAAENYCRDPSGYSRPWCKISPYMDYCAVPVCDWSPFA